MFWRLKSSEVVFKSFHELDLDDVVTKKGTLLQQLYCGLLSLLSLSWRW